MKGLRINSNLVRTLMIYVSLLQLLAICVFVWSIYMSLNGFYEFFGIIIIDLWKSTLYLIISIVTLIIVMLYLIYELIKLSNLEKK